MSETSSPSGWYQDPTGAGEARYWNGASWTQQVNSGGHMLNAPIDPQAAQLPPVPGTQVGLPPAPAPSSSGGSAGGAIIAIVIGLLLVAAIVLVVQSDDETPTEPPPGSEQPVDPPAEESPAEGSAPAGDG